MDQKRWNVVCRSRSVSYTHLDVYKRQTLYQAELNAQDLLSWIMYCPSSGDNVKTVGKFGARNCQAPELSTRHQLYQNII